MADLVILAAGRGDRAGGPKGLLHREGRPWILSQIDLASNLKLGRIVCVVASRDLAAFRAILEVPLVPRVELVVNPDPERGPFSSLQEGLKVLLTKPPGGAAESPLLATRTRPIFVLPVDVPAPTPQVWRELEVRLQGGAQVTQPEFNGKGGHPVLLAPTLCEKLCALEHPEARRLDHILRELSPWERLRVAVDDPEILMNLNERADWESVAPVTRIDFIGRQAGLLALVEIGIGSLLHALRVPLRGQALSINQCFFLSRAVLAREKFHRSRSEPFLISSVAALLKSLSPMGGRLGPMLAISAQGFLYTLGIWIFGRTLPGAILGSMLSGMWAFLQPLAGAYILFGATFFKAGAGFAEWTSEHFPWLNTDRWILLLVGILSLKALLCTAAAMAAWFMNDQGYANYEKRMKSWAARSMAKTPGPRQTEAPRPLSQAALGALKDLTHPLFLFSLLITGVFLMYAEGDGRRVLVLMLRPLALGFAAFFFLRSAPVDKWLLKMSVRSARSGVFRALEIALRVVRGERPPATKWI